MYLLFRPAESESEVHFLSPYIYVYIYVYIYIYIGLSYEKGNFIDFEKNKFYISLIKSNNIISQKF